MRGSLLIFSPWGLDEELHRLNDLAAEICATTEAVLLNVKEIA